MKNANRNNGYNKVKNDYNGRFFSRSNRHTQNIDRENITKERAFINFQNNHPMIILLIGAIIFFVTRKSLIYSIIGAGAIGQIMFPNRTFIEIIYHVIISIVILEVLNPGNIGNINKK